ncbi:hypothetical protein [Stieleria mannarensis]|uniref:hypothetical protein n=1 Tax=Stieleria mannarensis TaxID=2755585 RepID=UPI0015FF5093|nr:hypothetical protein [Rhodopirellula sp. JC639]
MLKFAGEITTRAIDELRRTAGEHAVVADPFFVMKVPERMDSRLDPFIDMPAQCRTADLNDRTRLDVARQIGGTLGFAAPEQIDPAFGHISPKTDTYAIGGLIHWYLSGTPPNAGDGAAETLLKTIEDQRSQDPTDPQPEAPLQAILRSSLAPSPAARTATVEEILQRLTTDLATTAPPAKSPTGPG